MAVSFPGSYDNFSAPTSPATTPLGSQGDSQRNHAQSHEDLGNAIEQIEKNLALKAHDHSGTDPLNPTSKLKQVNTHELADTDKARTSLHHTLGFGANQAAPGNHTHMPVVSTLSEQNSILANWATYSGAEVSTSNPCIVYNSGDNTIWLNESSNTNSWNAVAGDWHLPVRHGGQYRADVYNVGSVTTRVVNNFTGNPEYLRGGKPYITQAGLWGISATWDYSGTFTAARLDAIDIRLSSSRWRVAHSWTGEWGNFMQCSGLVFAAGPESVDVELWSQNGAPGLSRITCELWQLGR